ncbi:MAG: hypothetical protein WCK42_01260 [Myxococcaceae bacterium]
MFRYISVILVCLLFSASSPAFFAELLGKLEQGSQHFLQNIKDLSGIALSQYEKKLKGSTGEEAKKIAAELDHKLAEWKKRLEDATTTIKTSGLLSPEFKERLIGDFHIFKTELHNKVQAIKEEHASSSDL